MEFGNTCGKVENVQYIFYALFIEFWIKIW